MRILRISGRLLLVALICGSVFMSVVTIKQMREPQMWIGRTKVMSRENIPEQESVLGGENVGSVDKREAHLANLGHICASKTVMERSVETLSALAINDHYEILRTVSVQPVPQTQILEIEVTSQNPEEAKAAADVIASEFRRFYNEVFNGSLTQRREFLERQLSDTARQLTYAHKKLEVAKDVQSEIDAKVIAETYAKLKTQLEYTRIREKESINSNPIKVIEPAYYVPVDRKIPLKMLTLSGSILLTLICGCMLAKSIRRVKPELEA